MGQVLKLSWFGKDAVTNGGEPSLVDSLVETPQSNINSSQPLPNIILHCKEDEDGFVVVDKQNEEEEVDDSTLQEFVNDIEWILSSSNYEADDVSSQH